MAKAKSGYQMTRLSECWPVDAPAGLKVFLCGEYPDGKRIWPFKGEFDSEEAKDVLKEYGDYSVASSVPCGSRVWYIYMDMNRKLMTPMTGEQISLI